MAVSKVLNLFYPHVQARRHAANTFWDKYTLSCAQCLFSALLVRRQLHGGPGALTKFGCKDTSDRQDDVISHMHECKMKGQR